ncbi:hypothetical protein [Myxococcus sp. Y35]|uniref:hypothetical protein n=1 Tax=Pseudomyxococcus flavus TaxID=3115648 RepID=UPI003CF28BAA
MLTVSDTVSRKCAGALGPDDHEEGLTPALVFQGLQHEAGDVAALQGRIPRRWDARVCASVEGGWNEREGASLHRIAPIREGHAEVVRARGEPRGHGDIQRAVQAIVVGLRRRFSNPHPHGRGTGLLAAVVDVDGQHGVERDAHPRGLHARERYVVGADGEDCRVGEGHALAAGAEQQRGEQGPGPGQGSNLMPR